MHSLVFCPAQSADPEYNQHTLHRFSDSQWIGTMVTALQNAGLIAHSPAAPTTPCSTDYLAGERFLELIVFMGCSPSVQLQPDKPGSAYCYISFEKHPEPGKLYSGSLSRPAQCKLCKSDLVTQQLHDCISTQTSPTCPQCEKSLDWSEIRWNKTIGLARDVILIHNIFPHEAIPADELVNTINRVSGINWRYFYI